MLLNGYLILTILFDIAQSRTLWLSAITHDEVTFAGIYTATVAAKAVLVVLESREKRRWLSWDVKEHSPEETSGLYALGVFFWLNSLFITGYRKLLQMSDLFPLDQTMSAQRLQEQFVRRVELRGYHGRKHGLARVLGKTLLVPLLLPIGPRIALTGFTFCQPFLIERLLNYLQQPGPEESANIGKGLIGATVLIYLGMALSSAFYWYFQERAMFMSRGCLASAVYKKTTDARLSAADDSAALTLMSTDVERIRIGFLMIQEFWANTIEVALASWLLQRQLGAAFAAPIIVVLICVCAATLMGRKAAPRQKAWMEKIQKRVGLMSKVIENMKHLKISGMTDAVEVAIQKLRVDELKVGGRFRMIQIIASVIAFVPLLLSPVFTFAVTSQTLDVTTIFTSISYLLLLANPLTVLFQCVPPLLGAFACLKRIQAFLEKEPRNDFRQSLLESPPEKSSPARHDEATFAIKIIDGNFGWADASYNLRDINVTIPRSNMTMVVGPIASGKSTLCKAILGETPSFQGQVIMGTNFRKVGYCDQTPYLANSTIRENIVGFSSFNEERYREVIEASMLTPDLLLFPHGDHTNIGSNGISLSGGQKQRVSIARALYLEADLLVFDDILSGLDADTEEQVFSRVFAASGLLKRRGATVILCTHSIRHLPNADHIIALGPDGSLVEEGTFQDLLANKKYVHGLGITQSDSRTSGSSTPTPEIDEGSYIIRTKSTVVGSVDNTPDQSRQTGDSSVYRYYFASMGAPFAVVFILLGISCAFFYNFTTIWLKYWSEDVISQHPAHSNSFYLGIYALFQICCLISLFFFLLVTFRTLILKSGAVIHKAALQTVMKAPLKFFTMTDSGVITNLFSQDMTLIDGELPMALMNFTVDGLLALGMAAIIATSSPWLVVSYPFILVVLFGVQKFYLRTSRQIRLLDLEAKSPL
jgi:ABC-type multidrug transport system fused ATPase/permease subunit